MNYGKMVRILSLNVRGISNRKKRRAIFQYVRERADIALLQETHSTVEVEKVWSNEWGGQIIFNHGESNARGVCILITNKSGCTWKNLIKGENGRMIKLEIICGNVNFEVINVYAPNKDSPHFFHEVEKIMYQKNSTPDQIILGDFNVVLDPVMDREGTWTNNHRAKKILEQVMRENLLVDVWRIRNESTRRYSWAKIGKDGGKYSRIDYCLATSGIDAKISNVTYLPGIMTDHSAVFVNVNCVQNRRGPGYWKLNSSRLRDRVFKKKLQEFIIEERESLDKTILNPQQAWDELKARIAVYAKQLSRQAVSENKRKKADLMEDKDTFEASFPLDSESESKYLEVCKKLDEIAAEEAAGIIFRAGAKWQELGEKNTKYFLSLEKRKYNSKTCQSILTEEGTLLVEDKEILDEQRNFYERLYTRDPTVVFKPDQHKMKQLNEKAKNR